jgi:hypothetical protein
LDVKRLASEASTWSSKKQSEQERRDERTRCVHFMKQNETNMKQNEPNKHTKNQTKTLGGKNGQATESCLPRSFFSD